ncbi:hypothetical protein PCIT_a3648 [Pseudoalteromonas citrea]|uniref:Haemolysin-type calcium binding-related domain-containing protein n=2 Tax=Pseudoalteromonas citrea TaxID=43655 RepID=A0AAD4FQS3_9GAMM|nr:calcium-binding protein [Pseudoalteromonas citrea]KAF7767599.1 hypothetical protein PCIT_a3648 [Pseudoalteromonas citrea]
MSGENNIFDFISEHEGVRKNIYFDHKGIPTIGIGYNLRNEDVLIQVLDKLGYSNDNIGKNNYSLFKGEIKKVIDKAKWNKSTLDANTKKINDILNKYKDKITDPELKAKAKDTFSFSEFGDDTAAKEAMKPIFETAIQGYENQIINTLASRQKISRADAKAHWDGLSESQRTTVLSLAFNGGTRAMVGKNLSAAIVSGNIHNAFFEVLFGSNRSKDFNDDGRVDGRSYGLQERRFAEAFKVLESMTLAQKKQLYALLSEQKGKINDYLNNVVDVNNKGEHRLLADDRKTAMFAKFNNLVKELKTELDAAEFPVGEFECKIDTTFPTEPYLIYMGQDIHPSDQLWVNPDGSITKGGYKDPATNLLPPGVELINTHTGEFVDYSTLVLRDVITGKLTHPDGTPYVPYRPGTGSGNNNNNDDDDDDDGSGNKKKPKYKPKPPPPPPRVPRDPLAVDLDGDGIETKSLENGVHFDLDNSGFAEKVSWLAPDDGFLFLDRNQDGIVNGGGELFGTETTLANGELARDGYEALAELDSNEDGIIDAQDTQFAALKVWQDLNSDGVSSESELFSLAQLNITALSLRTSGGTGMDPNGVDHRGAGYYTRADGSQGLTESLWFERDTINTIPVEIHQSKDKSIPPELMLLPDADGYGNMASLRYAMLLEEGDQLKTLVRAFAEERDPVAQHNILMDIIWQWAGIPADAPSEGVESGYVQFLEKLWGEEITSWTLNRLGDRVKAAFDEMVEGFYFQMLSTSTLAPYLGFLYDDAVDLVESASQLVTDIEQGLVHGDYLFRYIDILDHYSEPGESMLIEIYSLVTDELRILLLDPQKRLELANGDFAKLLAIVDSSLSELELFPEVALLQSNGKTDQEVFEHIFPRIQDEVNAAVRDPHKRAALSELSFVRHAAQSYGRILNGTSGHNLLMGDEKDNRIYGGMGNDILLGGKEADSLYGGADNDVLFGGAGNDVLSGGFGNDELQGESGNDQLDGGAGEDILQGGQGNDILTGGADNDTYLWDLGDGNDIIINDNSRYRSDAHDKIEFGPGVTKEQVYISRQNKDVILTISPSGETITIRGYLTSQRQQIDVFEFHDGTEMTASEVKDQLLTVNGDAQNDMLEGNYNEHDILYGHAGDDQLSGKSGNDDLYGGTGQDILHGDHGHDELFGDEGNDTLNGGSGDDTLFGGAGDDNLEGSSGDDFISGDAGNDTLKDTSGDNVFYFEQGWGQDKLLAPSESFETYLDEGGNLINADWRYDPHNIISFGYGISFSDMVFKRVDDSLLIEHGQDSLLVESFFASKTEFGVMRITAHIDEIHFDNGEVISYEQIKANIFASTASDDVIIGFTQPDLIDGGAGDDTIQGLQGSDHLKGGLGHDQVEGGEGRDTLYGGGGNDTLNGGEGIDRLFGGYDNDTLDGGKDDDSLVGGEGQDNLIGGSGNDRLDGGYDDDILQGGYGEDTYLFSKFWGQDVIEESGSQNDRIVFEDGITQADVRFVRDHNDLTIVANEDGSQIYLGDYFWGDGRSYKAVEVIEFSDGQELTYEDLFELMNTATEGDDQLYGKEQSAVEIYGLGGNDTIISYGQVYSKFYGGVGNDLIEGNGYLDGGTGNDELRAGFFDDNHLAGGEGDDKLIAYFHDFYRVSGTFEGGRGNDEISGSLGNDTYIFNKGDGQDTITEWEPRMFSPQHEASHDVLQFGDGIRKEDLVFRQVHTDLVIEIAGDSDKITVKNWFMGTEYYKVNELQFKDGTVLSIADIEQSITTDSGGNDGDNTDDNSSASVTNPGGTQDVLTGSDGDDVLSGGAGSDDLIGGAGNDLLLGGRGDDYYFYDSGQDVIRDSEGADTVMFRNGITFSDVASGLTRSGDDLVLRVQDSNENTLTIEGFFASGHNMIEAFQFETGGMFNAQQIYGAFGLPLPDPEAPAAVISYGTAGSDTLNGTDNDEVIEGMSGDDTVSGGKGNDVLIGGRGHDRYLYRAGDGQDVIDNTHGGDDVIELQGVSFSDVASGLQKSGDNLVLNIGSGGDKLTVKNWFLGGDFVVEQIQVSDGSNISADQIFSAFGIANPSRQRSAQYDNLPDEAQYESRFAGAANNDTLLGSSSADMIDGKQGDDWIMSGGGNDYLIGGAGDDTYVIGTQAGHVLINNFDESTSRSETLKFESAHSTDVQFRQSDSDLVIELSATSSVIVLNYFAETSQDAYQLERLQFADSVVLTPQDVAGRLLKVSEQSAVQSSFERLMQAAHASDMSDDGAELGSSVLLDKVLVASQLL